MDVGIDKKERKALVDLSEVVNREIPVPKRGLAQREKSGVPYWIIEP